MPTLSWFDRDKDLTRSALAPYRLLEPVPSLAHGDADSPNMLIEGDNLDALKALLPYSRGDLVDRIHRAGEISSLEHTPDGTLVVGRANPDLAGELAAYAV